MGVHRKIFRRQSSAPLLASQSSVITTRSYIFSGSAPQSRPIDGMEAAPSPPQTLKRLGSVPSYEEFLVGFPQPFG